MARTTLNVPLGTIIDFAGTSIPSGYLECDGSAVSRTGYAALFAAIGTAWGAGDGSTTFNLPDLRGRTTIGSGTGTAGGATQHDFASLGGDERMQSHQHTMGAHNHSFTQPTVQGKYAKTAQKGTNQNRVDSDGSSKTANPYVVSGGAVGAMTNASPTGASGGVFPEHAALRDGAEAHTRCLKAVA